MVVKIGSFFRGFYEQATQKPWLWGVVFFSLLVLVFGGIPRFYDSLKFLPAYSIDENEIVEYAVGYFGGDYDQRFYSYGPLLSYLMYVVYWVMSLFVGTDRELFLQDVFFDNTVFYYTARCVNAILCLSIGVIVFKIIEHLWDRTRAYWMLPLLLFPLADILTNFTPRVDVLLGLVSALSLYFMLRYVKRVKRKFLLLSALFAGMSFACKPLPSILILPSLFFALAIVHFPKHKAKKSLWQKLLASIPNVLNSRDFYLFLTVTCFAAYLFFPHAFENWENFKTQQQNRIALETGKSGIAGWRLDYYIRSLGWLFVWTAIVGTIYGIIHAIKTNHFLLLMVLLFPCVCVLAFSQGPGRHYWYTHIVYMMVVGILFLLNKLLEYIKKESLKPIVALGVVLLLLLQPAITLGDRTAALNQKKPYSDLHTALSARKWIEENLPSNGRLAMYGYYVNLPRLVDKDVNRQAQIGEYFMYYKGGNQYYTQLFVQAHQRYVQNKNNKLFQLFQQLTYQTPDGKKGTIPLRYRNKKIEPHLLSLLQARNIQYLVTTHKQESSEWDSLQLKSFSRPKYSAGSNIYIYKIR